MDTSLRVTHARYAVRAESIAITGNSVSDWVFAGSEAARTTWSWTSAGSAAADGSRERMATPTSEADPSVLTACRTSPVC